MSLRSRVEKLEVLCPPPDHWPVAIAFDVPGSSTPLALVAGQWVPWLGDDRDVPDGVKVYRGVDPRGV